MVVLLRCCCAAADYEVPCVNGQQQFTSYA
jgi:hypothetical protein